MQLLLLWTVMMAFSVATACVMVAPTKGSQSCFLAPLSEQPYLISPSKTPLFTRQIRARRMLRLRELSNGRR
jgi:hypothetical protein